MRIIILSLFCASGLFAQTFWTKTPSAPTGDATTTDIAIAPVTGSIFVSTTAKGIYRSEDEGAQWEQQTADTAIFCLNARPDGMIIAGGIGCVYFTHDDGDTWTRKNINSVWPVQDIVFDSDGGIYVTTADVEDVGGTGYFRGDGIFYSSDDGQTWEQRNTGISGSLSAWNITVTSEDDLVVAMNDDRSGQAVGGIYFSEDKGQNWTKINFRMHDGQALYENIVVTNIRDLMVGENDTVYMMLEAIYTNFQVQLNAKIVMSDLKQSGVWHLYFIFQPVPNPISQPILSRMFRQSSGTLWGSMNSLGMFVSTDLTQTWTRKISGLDPRLYSGGQPRFFVCRMAEYIDGTIYLVQGADTAVYKADSSQLSTAIAPVKSFFEDAVIFPNPAENHVEVAFELDEASPVELSLFDTKGAMLRILYSGNLPASRHRIPVELTETPGVYFIRLRSGMEEGFMQVTKL